MEENLFVNAEYSPVKHKASRFSVRKYVTKKQQQKKGKKSDTWMDWYLRISGPGPVSFLSRSSMYYTMLTLHNPINPLSVVSTDSFSWATYFCISYYVVYKQTETAATCPKKQFRHKIHLFFLPIWQEEINKVIFLWVYELENNLY